MEEVHFNCAQCGKFIEGIEASKSFITCPFCGIRILVPKDDEDHEHFRLVKGVSHQEDHEETVMLEGQPPEPEHHAHKLSLRKERGVHGDTPSAD